MSGRCVLCLGLLQERESPEHVLLNAFGGRLTTREALCTACNHRTNELADQHFAADFAFWRNYLNLPSGDGDPPPTIQGCLAADGTRYDLAPGGRPVAAGPLEFTRDPQRPGSASFAGPAERIAPQLPNFAKGLGLPVEKLGEGIHSGFAEKATPLRNETRQITVCAPSHLCSITKSALILWSLAHGNEHGCRSSLGEARAFALGGPIAAPFRGIYDPRPDQLEPPEHLARGPFDSWLAVWRDRHGNLYAHLRLLGHFGYSIRLGTCDEPLEGTMLWTNPIEGKWWRGPVEPPVRWQMPDELSESVIRHQLELFLWAAQQRHAELALESAIDRVMAVHLPPDAQSVSPDQLAAIMTELDLTLSMMFSGDEDVAPLSLSRTREQTLRQLGLSSDREQGR